MSNRSASPELDWEHFQVNSEDLEFLSSYLLEVETPLSPEELAVRLIMERLKRLSEAEADRQASQKVYLPKERYGEGDTVVFPALDWIAGRVTRVRPAQTFNGSSFEVLQIQFEEGQAKEFAAGLVEHSLNQVVTEEKEVPEQTSALVAQKHAKQIAPIITEALHVSPEFVYIAGRWFPRSLIVDVGEGQRNVAEAFLDMAGGGPLPTSQLLGQVELPPGVNPKLAEFSLDLALQEDPRFDEVGPSGEVAWFLNRLEPEAVRETPLFLRYQPVEHDRSLLSQDMLDLEQRLDDELSPQDAQQDEASKEIQIPLIFPHWRVGSLPLTRRISRLFPSAYESPRVRFEFVDAQNGQRYQGWVVRSQRYIYGLRDWYLRRGLMPGSLVHVRRGEKPGEVLVSAEAHRSSKEWVRTALVGADGGVVYATLKQQVESSFDERMVIYLPGELGALESGWQRRAGRTPNLEKIVMETIRELAKLNTQNHVHAVELYSALNLIMRCPPAPLLAMLSSNSNIQHVGHLHFRIAEAVAQP
jgi:hypothetical protein